MPSSHKASLCGLDLKRLIFIFSVDFCLLVVYSICHCHQTGDGDIHISYGNLVHGNLMRTKCPYNDPKEREERKIENSMRVKCDPQE